MPGWQDRSRFIGREGSVDFFPYDFYAQALSKLEQGHAQDLSDVQAMLNRDLIEADTALALFERIAPDLFRYPAITPATFRRKVALVFGHS